MRLASMRRRDAMEEQQGSNKRMRVEGEPGPSEAEILQMAAQRESLRKQRRFAESDQIREELRSMGVELNDRDKEWHSQDGRTGVLFTAGPHECTLSDAEILGKVKEREEARRMKDFGRADELRDELRENGVELDDRESAWRTSGGRAGTYAGGATPVTRRTTSAAVQKIVAERERLRAAQDFEGADELRRKLAGLGVDLFDNERVWRSRDGQQGVIVSGGHEVDCALSNSDIAARVAQREEARNAKDWGHADSIREELRMYGVEMVDHHKVWRTTDGRHGSYGGSGVNAQLTHVSTPAHSSSKSGGGSFAMMAQQQLQHHHSRPTTPTTSMPISTSRAPTPAPGAPRLSDATIEALVAGRERMRDKHDWQAADAIRQDMRTHGVDVWDREKVWCASDGRSGAIPHI
eukprot:NODE_4213_length_1920_cov_7.063581.p1 GENE.NODE_4213_length_1920_cov_7.063581~~NODE_4213_length_1920_cov_7.063581.p1  ORF type:complete len:407 (-),score=147.25 NODE_4213_length_1920_cov_7.063581:482-1702(-)